MFSSCIESVIAGEVKLHRRLPGACGRYGFLLCSCIESVIAGEVELHRRLPAPARPDTATPPSHRQGHVSVAESQAQARHSLSRSRATPEAVSGWGRRGRGGMGPASNGSRGAGSRAGSSAAAAPATHTHTLTHSLPTTKPPPRSPSSVEPKARTGPQPATGGGRGPQSEDGVAYPEARQGGHGVGDLRREARRGARAEWRERGVGRRGHRRLREADAGDTGDRGHKREARAG